MDYRSAQQIVEARTGRRFGQFSKVVYDQLGEGDGSGHARDYTRHDIECLVLSLRYNQIMGSRPARFRLARKFRMNVPPLHVPGWLLVKGSKVRWAEQVELEDLADGVLALPVHQDCRCRVEEYV